MEEINDNAKREKVRVIPIDQIDDFSDHPFQVKGNEDMPAHFCRATYSKGVSIQKNDFCAFLKYFPHTV